MKIDISVANVAYFSQIGGMNRNFSFYITFWVKKILGIQSFHSKNCVFNVTGRYKEKINLLSTSGS